MINLPSDFDIQLLARTVYGLARGCSEGVRTAVAATVINRIIAGAQAHAFDRWGMTIAEACLRPGEYSCWNSDDDNMRIAIRASLGDKAFMECFNLAVRAAYGFIADRTEGATHFRKLGDDADLLEHAVKTLELEGYVFYRLEVIPETKKKAIDRGLT